MGLRLINRCKSQFMEVDKNPKIIHKNNPDRANVVSNVGCDSIYNIVTNMLLMGR